MRLIDLDTLKQNLCGECTMNFPKECRQIGCTKVDKQDFLEALRLPIIDAVPVIRCKDCKYCTKFEVYKVKWYVCTKHENNIDVKAEDFCSYAERGNNETV